MNAWIWLFLACSPKTEEPDTSPPEDSTPEETWTLEDLGGACPTESRVGSFEVSHWEGYDPPFSTISGVVRDGVIPATVMVAQEASGDCTLFQKQNPFCDPPCEAEQACSLESECVPYPLQQDVGTVEITGLSAAVSLSPDTYANYWTTTVPYPLFDPGGAVKLENTGAPALSLRGLGVDPIVAETAWNLQSGEDLTVTWTPGAAESRIVVSMNVDQHGNSPVTLICDTADTGALTIDGALLDRLVQYGTSGFTTSTIVRRVADHQDTELGCVDLLVYSMREGELTL